MERKTIQDLYVRLCRDSGFKLDYVQAAILTGKIVGVHPLQVWMAMPSLGVMEQIATGNHPACVKVT